MLFVCVFNYLGSFNVILFVFFKGFFNAFCCIFVCSLNCSCFCLFGFLSI